MKEDEGFAMRGGFVAQIGDGAVRVTALEDTGVGWAGDAEAQIGNRHTSVRADDHGFSDAPDKRPPRALGRWTQDGTALAESLVPRGLGVATDFAMAFMLIVMEAERIERGIRRGGVGQALGSEERGQAILPIGMEAFDLALGLRSGRVAQGNVVELQRTTELG